jgi:hypothetical protein
MMVKKEKKMNIPDGCELITEGLVELTDQILEKDGTWGTPDKKDDVGHLVSLYNGVIRQKGV